MTSTPNQTISWLGVLLFWVSYFLVLLFCQEFPPWLNLSLMSIGIATLLFHVAPVIWTIVRYKKSSVLKKSMLAVSILLVPVAMMGMTIAGADLSKIGFVLNYPLYSIHVMGRDKLTVQRDEASVFLGGGWTRNYVYDASDAVWHRYQIAMQSAAGIIEGQQGFEIRDKKSNVDGDCEIITPLIGHWYLQYLQYGGGFVRCEGLVGTR